MIKRQFITFQTQIGICGISWSNNAVTGLLLPESSTTNLIKKLKADSTCELVKTPPSWIKDIIKKVSKHLEGDLQDFSDIPTDTEHLSEFTNSIYKAAKKIPAGKIISYQKLAEKVKKPNASRATGSALGKNPILLIIPCHRIINSSGKLGGFSAAGGIETKLKLLEIEGVFKLNP